MEAFRQDIRYGFRMLMAKPSFTIIAILALALGIGVNSAIFSVVNGVLLKPLGYKQPDKLVRIWEKWGGFDQGSISYPNFQDWRDRNKSFESIAAYRWTDFNLTGIDQPERLSGREVSADFLTVLGINPEVGHNFTHDEDRDGASPVAMISDSLWKSRFSGDRSVIGKTISLDDKLYQIVGVLPADFPFFSSKADVLVPIAATKARALKERSWHPGTQAIARLKPGMTLEQARADITSIANALGQEYPNTNKEHSVTLNSLYDATVSDVRKGLYMLLAAVLLVLLIACANVANLMLARASVRQKEIAIRTALGASRTRIMRLLITESVMLALTGGVLGLVAAYWGTGLALKALPDVLPRVNDITVDSNVLLFTLAVSIVTGVIFGLAPALQASNPNLNETLKEGGRSGTGRQTLRSTLVVAEIAISLVLLVGAGLLIRSFVALNRVNPGFDDQNILTFDISLSSKEFANADEKPDAPKIRRFFKQFTEKVDALPGIEAAAPTELVPLAGSDDEEQFFVTGRPKPSPSELPLAMTYIVDSGYQKTMRVPLLKGRFFTDSDTQTSGLVMVIDEVMAKRYFANEDPVGQHINLPVEANTAFEFQVIGVVGHVKQQNLDTADGAIVGPQMYISFNQVPDEFIGNGIAFVARTNAQPASFVPAIRETLRSVGGTATLSNAKTMEEIKSDQLSNRRFALILIGFFSALALILASIGIYGVISYSVAQRTREIGIRMAVGASQRQVLAMVVGNAIKLALIGIAVGAAGAFGLTRFISFILYGVSPSDPLTFTGISIVLALVAIVASYVPARRAMKVDPNTALRYE
ncbi:MAG TPA: ABC transporter permease [Blastocatellia bacterium]|nr:ABC transporter permease [Blastocatellia bacterium]